MNKIKSRPNYGFSLVQKCEGLNHKDDNIYTFTYVFNILLYVYSIVSNTLYDTYLYIAALFRWYNPP